VLDDRLGIATTILPELDAAYDMFTEMGACKIGWRRR
jgi:hypothetical protein